MNEELKIKISAEVSDMKKNVKDAKKTIEGFSDDSSKSISGFKETVKKAGSTVKDIVKGNLLANGFTAIAGACVEAVKGVSEYRDAQNHLNSAFEAAGSNAETAKATFDDLYRTLGDTDVAVEASGHLAKLTQDQQSLSEWTNICQGVYAQFGDSLPIEGLTEAANETAKTGELTGSLADALNWAGVSEDDFQKKLDKCNTEAEREQTIRETLNGLYKDSADAFEDNNKALLDQNDANRQIQDSLAKISEALAPIIALLTKVIAKLIEKLAPYLTEFIEWVAPKVEDAIGWIADKWDDLKESVSNIIDKFKDFKQTCKDTFEDVKQKAEDVVDKIKSVFDFKWELPKLKMPHFKATGSFSLMPLSVPKFNIDWYANGGVFDSPTLFNYGSGSLGGLGEAGAEAIVPLEKNTRWLDRLATMLAEKSGGNRPMVLKVDGKVFGEVAIDSINGVTQSTGSLPLILR